MNINNNNDKKFQDVIEHVWSEVVNDMNLQDGAKSHFMSYDINQIREHYLIADVQVFNEFKNKVRSALVSRHMHTEDEQFNDLFSRFISNETSLDPDRNRLSRLQLMFPSDASKRNWSGVPPQSLSSQSKKPHKPQ